MIVKVYTKNRNYELEIRRSGWVRVKFQGRTIADVLNEEAARQAVWLHSGKKCFVCEDDMELKK